MIKQLKMLLAGFLVVGTLGMAGTTASAQFDVLGDPCTARPDATVCKDNDKTQTTANNSLFGPDGVVGRIVRILSVIVGVASVIVIIVAGIQYMTSSGDSTKVNNAKNAIIYALVGVLVAVMAQVIVVYIVGRLA